MRLGEIKNILDSVVDEDHNIAIEHEAIFGGQGQMVKNYGGIIEALEVLFEQSWNDQSSAEIEEIIGEHGNHGSVSLTAAEFNQLNRYINQINTDLPLYYSVLEDNVDEQSEATINVKLPERKINSFQELNDLNDRLSAIFKEFNIDGQVDFVGFDIGSEWYVIEAAGTLTYAFIIACLDIAKSYFETRESYFKSEEAKVSYLASLKKDAKPTEIGQKNHSEKSLDIKIQVRIDSVVEQIGSGNSGRTLPEIKSQLIKATTKLCDELQEGTEFHLSLNPPEYAEESNGSYKINYELIRSIVDKTEKTKEITPAPAQEKTAEEE